MEDSAEINDAEDKAAQRQLKRKEEARAYALEVVKKFPPFSNEQKNALRVFFRAQRAGQLSPKEKPLSH